MGFGMHDSGHKSTEAKTSAALTATPEAVSWLLAGSEALEAEDAPGAGPAALWYCRQGGASQESP